jgi:hypothetical protein
LLRAGLHPLLAVFITLLAMMAGAYHFHPRPHLMTIVLLGWTFAQLCDFEAGRISLPRLFWLLPVFVLWANMHGGMVGGIGTVAVAVAGWAIASWIRWGSPLLRMRQILLLSLLAVGCGLAAFVNPYGTELPRVWFSLMGSPVLPLVIQEHGRLWGSGPAAPAVLLFGFVYVAALLGVLPARPRVTWFIPLIWLALAWTRVRHGPLFATTAVIALADIFPHVRWAQRLARHGSKLFRLRPQEGQTGWAGLGWQPLLIPIVLVLTSVVLQLTYCSVPVLGRDWAQLKRSKWPLELLPELREIELSGQSGTPIFNDMLYGGFLIYFTPGLRVFIDDRCELYGDEGLIDYGRALQDPPRIEAWVARYGFETALVQTDSAFDQYFQSASGWSMVRRTEAATLYRRTDELAHFHPSRARSAAE